MATGGDPPPLLDRPATGPSTESRSPRSTGRTEVAIWGGPEPAIVVTVYSTDPSYVLAIATKIAAARDFGDGIGDAQVAARLGRRVTSRAAGGAALGARVAGLSIAATVGPKETP